MQYDPIKDRLGRIVKKSPFLRKIFYNLLGLMFLREWYVKRRIKELYKGNPPNEILDAGCGFGQYSYFTARRFPEANILAVDVKIDYLDDCRYFFNRSGIKNTEFEFADLTKINFENRFDFILSVDVMEHIEDDIGVFRKFHKALRSGGRVLINTPSNLGGSDAESEQDESFIGEHVRLGYSKEDICSKLMEAGFEIESFEYTYGKWGNRYWKLGIKYPMLMLNKSQFFFIILPFYYLLTIWLTLLFMLLDVNEKNKSAGTGVLVIGRKA
ncbi:MAG: class I SAM-dependent methyltransferase [Chlorobi bacterium]|nr:class I SAM-dependent methyltransferase [Chlorobiota bacterium]MCI0714806.1 class I SAM-dependent methyltransferase [Chlorobiota bacterium]